MSLFLVAILVLNFIIKLRFPTTKSIASIITRRYGSDALHKFRAFERNDYKIKKTQQDLNFLSSCKFHSVIPHFLNFKLANSRLRSSMMYDSCRRRLLSIEIAGKKNLLKKLNEKNLAFRSELRNIFSWLDFHHLTSFADSTNLKSIKHVEFIHSRKLNTLLAEYLKSGIDPDSVIFNYSNYVLNNIEKKVLSRGLRFSIYPNKLDYCSFLTPFGKRARGLQSRTINKKNLNFDYIKTKLKNIALS